MEDGSQLLSLPAMLEPISRPSSASTQASLVQLPGIAALAAGSASSGSPLLRESSLQLLATPPAPATAAYATSASAPAPSAPVGAASLSGPTTIGPNWDRITCMNCTTATTPLWRRDEQGAVLCNACGLFLKLHGRPRPISLKTDVIKSRNRVKTSMRPDMTGKKKNAAAATEPNGVDLQNHANAAAAVLNARRASQKSANGHVEGADSPVSRTATPHMYNPHLPAYPGVGDGQYAAQPLANFGIDAGGRAPSPLNGDRLDAPHTLEQLMAANASLRTRISEMEVINDFMQRRLAVADYVVAPEGQDANGQTEVQQLRGQVDQLKVQIDQLQQTERADQLKAQLDESHRRENMLKRRLDEMEKELEAKNAVGAEENERAAKKSRLGDIEVDDSHKAAAFPVL